jgi:Glycosyltransferase like family 2
VRPPPVHFTIIDMGASLEFALLCVCWLSALATLLIFLETCFSLSPRDRFMARRASGAYGVISVLVPMWGPAEKLERTIKSIFGQSYPFIELFLIYPKEDQSLEHIARGFQSARSHIPVRLVQTTFPISSPSDVVRALELAHGNARGRWLVTLDADVLLDRFAVEAAVEFAGSN